jgi:hypothetical protein
MIFIIFTELFTKAKRYTQPKCPITIKCKNTMCHTHNIIYPSKEGNFDNATTWMKVEDTVLSNITSHKYCMIDRCQWLTHVILATQEAEIRRITAGSQLRQIVHVILSQKNTHARAHTHTHTNTT